MAKTDRWMPLHIGDYLADTMHLNAEEHGAYLLLIFHYWRTGPLPDDDRTLAGIARVDRKSWDKSTGCAVRAFFVSVDGKLTHKRIDFEIAKTGRLSEKRREAANKRHHPDESDANGGQNDSNPPANDDANDDANDVQIDCKADAIALQMDTHARAIAIARQSQRKKESKKGAHYVRDAKHASVVEVGSVRNRLYRDGLSTLRDMTGLSDGRARAALGMLLRKLNDDAAAALAILAECADLNAADPIAWLTAAAQARGSPTPSRRRESHSERLMREMGLDDGPAETVPGPVTLQ